MAEDKKKSTAKKLQVRRKAETVRERSEKVVKKSEKVSRTKKVATKAVKGVGTVRSTLKKEYSPIKTDKNKVGRVLTKSRRFTPGYFINSYRELKKVTWPTRKMAAKLTFAVFAFSVVFASLIRAIDYGFERLFKDVILK